MEHIGDPQISPTRLIEKGDFERAARQLEKAAEVSPSYADAYGSLAAVHIKMGRYVQALTEIRQAIGVAGPNARDLSNQALAYYDLEDYAASIKAARWALRLDPNYAPAHFVLGATLAIEQTHHGGVGAPFGASDQDDY